MSKKRSKGKPKSSRPAARSKGRPSSRGKRTTTGKSKARSKKVAGAKTPAPPPLPHNLKAGFWKENILAGLILLALPFVLYGASIGYGYVLDDKIVLSENLFVKKGFAGIGDIFSTESFSGYEFFGNNQGAVTGGRYRPLSLATFAIEYAFVELKPGLSHFINILLYALTGLLIFRLFSLFFLKKEGISRYLGIPFLAAALFLLHPVHTEVVANIKGRDEILAVLLGLAAIYFSYRYWAKPHVIPLVLSGILFLLALFAKENAITLVPLVPLTFWFFCRSRKRELLIMTLPLLIASAVFLYARMNALGYFLTSGKEVTSIMNNPFYGVGTGDKYATIFLTLGKYIQLLFVPHPLTHDYYPYQIPIIGWGDWRALLSLAFYLGLAYLAFRTFKQRSPLSWGILFFLATLSVTSNLFFPIGAFMNERFIYLPSLGFCILLAWLLVEKLPGWQPAWGKTAGIALLGIFALGFAIKSFTRVPDWKDHYTLNQAAARVSVNSARANSYMAYSMYLASRETSDRQKKDSLLTHAFPYVDRALKIYPTYTDAVNCKGGLLSGKYQLDKDLDALLDGFHDLLFRAHVPFFDQYMAYLNKREDPNKLVAFYHKAGFQVLAEKKRNYPIALKYLKWAQELQPQNGQILEDLAITYFRSRNYQQVIETGNAAVSYGVATPKLREFVELARGKIAGK